MHILFLHQYFCPPGGKGNNRSLEIAESWVREGHKVTLLTSPAYFPAEFKQAQDQYSFVVRGIRVLVAKVAYSHQMSFRERILSWLRFYRKGREILKKESGFDLIYASSTPLTIGELGRRMAAKWKIPYVFETVDVWPDVPIGMGILSNQLLIQLIEKRTNRIYRDAAAIVALSEGMKEQVLAHGVSPAKVRVVHNGCNPATFPFILRPVRPECLVIYTGTVGLANGLHVLVDLAQRVHAKGRSDIRFLVIGQGNDLGRVKALAEGLGLPNLEFKDLVPKEEVPAWLEKADVGFVCFATHPVLEANSANKLYDYLATGLPVILNYEGWQARYLKVYKCGLPALQGDGKALLDNLLWMADHPTDRLEMGMRGRRLVEEKFDRRKLALRLTELFEQVLEEQET